MLLQMLFNVSFRLVLVKVNQYIKYERIASVAPKLEGSTKIYKRGGYRSLNKKGTKRKLIKMLRKKRARQLKNVPTFISYKNVRSLMCY